MLFQDRDGCIVRFFHDRLDFFVDLVGRLFRVRLLRCKVFAQEDLFGGAVVDRSQLLAEAVLGHHLSGDVCRSLDIVGCACADVVESELFGCTSAEQMDDLLPHLFLGSVVFVLLRQDHGESAGAASRDDRDLVHRIGFRQAVGNHGVTRFMVRGELALILTDHSALLLRSRDYLGDRFLDLLHPDDHAVSAGRQKRRFIEHILNVRRCEARRSSRQHLRVDALIQRLVARMDFEYLFSSCDVRDADDDLPVETARSEERRIQYIRTVCRRQNDDAGILRESIHLYEELVQRLFSFIMAAAQACASLTSDRVDLIDKNDTRRVLLSLIEQVSDSGCADTDEHLHKVRTADGEERHARLARGGL